MTKPILLMTWLALSGAGGAAAADCPLEVSVATASGAPAPGVAVMIMGGGFSRNRSRQASTDEAGRAAFSDLPCGKYQVFAGERPVAVDTKKQPRIHTTISDQMATALRRSKEYMDAFNARRIRPLTADEQRDEEAADAYRRATIGRFGTDDELKAYTNAPLDQRPMQFSMVLVKRLGTLGIFDTSVDLVKSGQRIEKIEALMAGFVERESGTSSRTYLAATARARARMALAASLSHMRRESWPSLTLLYYTDASQGLGARDLVRRVFGADSDEAKQWDDNLSSKWRGEMMKTTMMAAVDAAIAVADGQLSFEEFNARTGTPRLTEDNSRQELRTIGEMLGQDAVNEYMKSAPAGRAEMYSTAALTGFAFGWIMLASI